MWHIARTHLLQTELIPMLWPEMVNSMSSSELPLFCLDMALAMDPTVLLLLDTPLLPFLLGSNFFLFCFSFAGSYSKCPSIGHVVFSADCSHSSMHSL